MTSTNALEAQIAALIRQLEETKKAERPEEAQREAEAAVEKAHEEEQRRLQAEAEAEAEHERRDAEECHVKQERQEKEEEEVRHHRSHEESTLTPLAAPETELPKSKGKGSELALESEGAQESQRCNSCERWDAECVQ